MIFHLVHVAVAGGKGGMLDVESSQVKILCIERSLRRTKHKITRSSVLGSAQSSAQAKGPSIVMALDHRILLLDYG